MTPDDYLKETKHASHHLFEGLAYYRNFVKEMPHPIFISDIPFDDEEAWDKAFAQWHAENKEVIELSHKMSRQYFGLAFSYATICGSVLQIASMGIAKFSENDKVPLSCREFIKSKQRAIRYCVGREIRGLPIGIVIHAARNQYNHWDEPEPYPITKAVFEALALGHGHGDYRDPAFDLENPNLDIYSHNVLSLMQWNSYEDYHRDIQALQQC